MERKALIIASPCSGDDYLKGVAIDAQNYHLFLTSSLGGGWYDNEIANKHNNKSSYKFASEILTSVLLCAEYRKLRGCSGSTSVRAKRICKSRKPICKAG